MLETTPRRLIGTLKSQDTINEYSCRNSPKPHHRTKTAKAMRRKPFSLTKFSLMGQSEAMKQKMLTDVFVLNDIAILGQSTVIYAQFNTGKTLLTLCPPQIDNRNPGSDNFVYHCVCDHFYCVGQSRNLDMYPFSWSVPHIG